MKGLHRGGRLGRDNGAADDRALRPMPLIPQPTKQENFAVVPRDLKGLSSAIHISPFEIARHRDHAALPFVWLSVGFAGFNSLRTSVEHTEFMLRALRPIRDKPPTHGRRLEHPLI